MVYRYRYQLRYIRPYRYRRYRYWCPTEHTEVSGTAIDVVPNLPKCPVPVLMSYRTYRSVRYRYWCRTEFTEVSGTGIDVVPNLTKCPVPVLMYRTYRGVQHRYYRRYDSVRTVPNTPFFVCCSKGTLRIINFKKGGKKRIFLELERRIMSIS